MACRRSPSSTEASILQVPIVEVESAVLLAVQNGAEVVCSMASVGQIVIMVLVQKMTQAPRPSATPRGTRGWVNFFEC